MLIELNYEVGEIRKSFSAGPKRSVWGILLQRRMVMQLLLAAILQHWGEPAYGRQPPRWPPIILLPGNHTLCKPLPSLEGGLLTRLNDSLFKNIIRHSDGMSFPKLCYKMTVASFLGTLTLWMCSIRGNPNAMSWGNHVKRPTCGRGFPPPTYPWWQLDHNIVRNRGQRYLQVKICQNS